MSDPVIEPKVETPAADPAPTAGTGDQPIVDPVPSPDHKPEPAKPVKPKFTKRQTIKYNIDRMQKELETAPLEDGDDAPDVPEPVKTGLEFINEITNTAEKSAVEEKLKTMTPSGNPIVDFRLARLEVNTARNAMFTEEAARKPDVRRAPTSSGAPALVEQPFTPTADEAAFMRPPFNLTKDEILVVRKKEAEVKG